MVIGINPSGIFCLLVLGGGADLRNGSFLAEVTCVVAKDEGWRQIPPQNRGASMRSRLGGPGAICGKSGRGSEVIEI